MLYPNISISLASILLIYFTNSLTNAARYNVVDYGAKGDGKNDSTKAFIATWNQVCGSTKPATLFVPSGKFLIGKTVRFEGPCKNNAILFRIVGTLIAPSNYSEFGNAERWIHLSNVDGVTVYGGVLDGQGLNLWNCKKSGKKCPPGAGSLSFKNSKNIAIKGLTSLNSQRIHIAMYDCSNVSMQSLKVSASGSSPNTDGIHVQMSNNVTIFNTKIKTGDDCISVGSGCFNLWVENITCGPGHGISIGSLGWELNEAGVENVTIKTAILEGTQNGVRIKSWPRLSNAFARNISFQHIAMSNVKNPILIDQNYCPDSSDCPDQDSGVKISGIAYEDIHGTSTRKVAVRFDCSENNPCTEISLKDINLTYNNQPAKAYCANANGSASGFMQPSSCLSRPK